MRLVGSGPRFTSTTHHEGALPRVRSIVGAHVRQAYVVETRTNGFAVAPSFSITSADIASAGETTSGGSIPRRQASSKGAITMARTFGRRPHPTHLARGGIPYSAWYSCGVRLPPSNFFVCLDRTGLAIQSGNLLPALRKVNTTVVDKMVRYHLPLMPVVYSVHHTIKMLTYKHEHL